MTEYPYTGHPTKPDIAAFQAAVEASAMTDTANDGVSWFEETGIVCYCAINELSAPDEAILDALAAAIAT